MQASRTTKQAPRLEGIPEELRRRPRWMGTRFERRPDGKVDKPPYCVRQDRRITKADKTTPANWATFEEARDALSRREVDSIGIVLTGDDDLVLIDLDEVRDPQSGAIAPWAREVAEALSTYTEISCSGQGLHIIAQGRKTTKRCRTGSVEVYDRDRFVVLTGNHFAGTPTEPQPRQVELDAFLEQHLPEQTRKTERRHPALSVALADEELLDKAKNSRGGKKFRSLFDEGDPSACTGDDKSHSGADLELLRQLAFWTAWDADRMDRLFRASALYRSKWERDTYRNPTIAKAIATTHRAYQQPPTDTDAPLDRSVRKLRSLAASLAWEGRSGPTDRCVFGTLISIAEQHGTVKKTGVTVSADVRSVALGAGVSRDTAWKSLHRLVEDRKLVRRLRRKKGTLATLYLLKVPVTSTQGYDTYPCAYYVLPLRSVRNPAPKRAKDRDERGRKLPVPKEFLVSRIGKLAALIIERVALAGKDGTTVAALAAALGRRRCDVRRKVNYLRRNTSLLEGAGEQICLPEDFDSQLEAELEVSGCNDAENRDRKRYRREREAYLARHAHPPDEAPTPEELREWLTKRTHQAFEAFCYEGSGPQMILHTYMDHKTYQIEYVIKAVAVFYNDLERWLMWEMPVRRAMSCYMGWPVRS